jgi:DNA-binding NarL/FixJ family response regulator
MTKKLIRIHVIDDDLKIIVPGLKSMFRPSRDQIEISGESSTISDFMKCNPERYDIILLDLYIPDTQPEDNIRYLVKNFPGKPVVIYSTEEASVWKRKAFAAGVKGYITKKHDKKKIKYIITEVAAGNSVFYGLTDISENEKLKSALGDPPPLSPLEKVVVQKLRTGTKITVIADEVALSKSTVEKVLKELREKHKATNNIHLIECLKESYLF